VTTTKPVVLQEHDEYRWVPISEEPPVTGAVKKVLARYRELIDGQA
jgi:8-oxo-dGTP diphosphatase